MIVYKSQAFFVAPKEFTSRDIEFYVFDSNSKLVGTNFQGLKNVIGFTKEEKFELEEIIEEKTRKLEADLKCLKEFGVLVDDWKLLGKDRSTVTQKLLKNWNIDITEYVCS